MKAIFIVLDTLRRDFLEPYGSRLKTGSAAGRIAERGTTFDNHWVGSLPCMPARREMQTGRHNFLDRGWGPIEAFDDVLPRELARKGVFSHLITDHYHYFELGGANYHTGFTTWDFYRGQEGDPWASVVDRQAMPEHLGQLWEQNWGNRALQPKEEEFSGPKSCRAAIDWLHSNARSDNWFLQLELFDPHEPFFCPDEYKELAGDRWDGPHFDWPFYGPVTESPEAVAHLRACYAGLLLMTDRWVGRVLDVLDELALWDDTLVVLTTDHGTLLGEHGFWMKLPMPTYHPIARIPLVVHAPGQAGGERCSSLTQTIDLMPAFLEHFGCALPPHVQGRPLPKNAAAPVRQEVIYGYFGMAANITDGRYVYHRNPIREDGGPLHAYTSSLVGGITTWTDRSLYERIETGRYLSHAYNLPVYKVPATGRPTMDITGAPCPGVHALYDLHADPNEMTPLNDPGLEAHFAERLSAHLARCGAYPEQFLRLGLDPPSSQ